MSGEELARRAVACPPSRPDIERVREMICELLPISGDRIPLDRRMSNMQDLRDLLAELDEGNAPTERRELDTPRRRMLAERRMTAYDHGEVALALACELALAHATGRTGGSRITLACMRHALEAAPREVEP